MASCDVCGGGFICPLQNGNGNSLLYFCSKIELKGDIYCIVTLG